MSKQDVAVGVAVVIVLVGSLALYMFQTSQLESPQRLVFDLVAYQWGFDANGKNTWMNHIVIHVGDEVTFRIRATFELEPEYKEHSVFIAGITPQPISVREGETKTFTFTAKNPDEYFITCTTPCGSGHPGMLGRLRIEKP